MVIASKPKIVKLKATALTNNVITQLDILADLTALFVSPYILANQQRERALFLAAARAHLVLVIIYAHLGRHASTTSVHPVLARVVVLLATLNARLVKLVKVGFVR